MRKTSYGLSPFTKSKDIRLYAIAGGVVVAGVLMASVLLSRANRPVAQTIIQVTSTGFVPATVDIRAGTEVVWKNTDSAPHAVLSNPYPTGSDTPGLRSKTILPNGSYTFKAKSGGVIRYHDSTKPTAGGTIKVEK